jgi:hypothetical protein
MGAKVVVVDYDSERRGYTTDIICSSPEQDNRLGDYLQALVGPAGEYDTSNNCRTFSQLYWEFAQRFTGIEPVPYVDLLE